MKNTSIEITDQDYLIKLPREDFNLSFIHQLLNRIQAEQFFFTYKTGEESEDFERRDSNLDLRLQFDDLRDK